MSDYLWDRSGKDPEVEALERLLAPAALRAAPHRRARRLAWLAGIAAALFFAIGAAQVLIQPTKSEFIATGDGYSRLDLGIYGHVVAAPHTRVHVIRRDNEMQRLRLDLGTLHASITRAARPRLFQVETPGATCIDLGCRYTLTVDAQGVSRVQVDTGRVAFHDGRREVFIPEGASGRAAPGRAPFTPIYDDASDALKRAVEAFDIAPEGRRAGLAKTACALIKKREDGLVAWHWLQDPESGVVKAAIDALIRLTTVVECGVPRPADPTSRREWRNSLFPEWKDWD